MEERLGVYMGEDLSEKQNRALLARDTNTCDLSQKSLFFLSFFFWLEHSCGGACCGVPLLQMWGVTFWVQKS